MSLNKSECEIWFSEWFMTSSSNNSVGNHSSLIEKICRGPMKAVLSELLVKRAKTDTCLTVIRSNFYVHRQHVQQSDPDKYANIRQQRMELIVELKRREANLLETLSQKMNELYGLDILTSLFQSTFEKKILIESHRDTFAFICNFVRYMQQIKDSSNKGFMKSEDGMRTLDALTEETLLIFLSIFLRNASVDSLQLDYGKIMEIIPSILYGKIYSREIHQWNAMKRRECQVKIEGRICESSSSVGPNPIAQWNLLVSKKLFLWSQSHVRIHLHNSQLGNSLRNICCKKKKAQLQSMDACRSSSFLPVDFLTLLRREELKMQIRCCREILNSEVAHLWSSSQYSMNVDFVDSDVRRGTMIGGLKVDKSDQLKAYLYKNGVTEDIAVCLLKGWTHTKSRLINTRDRVEQVLTELLFPSMAFLSDRMQIIDCEKVKVQPPKKNAFVSLVDFGVGDNPLLCVQNNHVNFKASETDLNSLIDLNEELKCKMVKQGSCFVDILKDLASHSKITI